MTVQKLRAAHQTTPFQPVLIHMADGCQFVVSHPDFMFIHPMGRTVIICQGNEDFSILDSLMITDVKTCS